MQILKDVLIALFVILCGIVRIAAFERLMAIKELMRRR
jgi:hypothetical protein